MAQVFPELFSDGSDGAVVTGITIVFAFHMLCISIVRSLYFTIFPAAFLNTFLSPQYATSITVRVPFFIITHYAVGLLLGMVLSVCCEVWFCRFVVRYGSVGLLLGMVLSVYC